MAARPLAVRATAPSDRDACKISIFLKIDLRHNSSAEFQPNSYCEIFQR